MNLPTETFGAVTVVHTPEEMGTDQAAPLAACLVGLERDNLVLDLDHTELIDSVGLESLLGVRDRLRERGGAVKIATTNPTNRKILEITRLDLQFEVFDSVIDAVKSFH